MKDSEIKNALLDVSRDITAAVNADEDMSKERMPKLYVRLEKWVTKLVMNRPSTAPIVTQVLKSLRAVRNQIKGKMSLTGRDAVLAFCKACGDHFTIDASPLSTLSKKYGWRLIEDMLEGRVRE